MESLWNLLNKAVGIDELHHLAIDAKQELADLKDRLEELEKKLSGEHYVPQEYPKMTASGKTVWNAEEEAAEAGIVPVSAVPVGEELAASETVTEASTNADESPEVV